MNDLTKNNENKPENFEDAYSEKGFWDKLSKYAKIAGEDLVEKVLILYYTLTDEKTSTKNRAIIVAALGYFISPIDAIPDIIPIAGYADDLGVIVAALTALRKSITDEIQEKAKSKVRQFFG